MLKLSLAIASILLLSPLIAQDAFDFGIEPPDGTPKHCVFLFAPGLPPGEITQVSGMHFRTRKSSLNALDALGVALRMRFGSLLEERLAISE